MVGIMMDALRLQTCNSFSLSSRAQASKEGFRGALGKGNMG